MNKNILITGATGFLGTFLADTLLDEFSGNIYVLVRAKDKDHAVIRLKSAWKDFPIPSSKIGKRIIPVIGDLTRNDLGLSSQDADMLISTTDIIIHSAADVGITKSEDQLINANLVCTKNLLAFASNINDAHTLERFVHISTAYVAGQRGGLIMEDSRPVDNFSTHYEKSKAMAEELVQQSGLPYSICRPSMIIGSTKNGYIKSFNTIYYVIKLILTGKLSTLPISRKQQINIVPVDFVAQAVTDIAFSPDATGKIFHLTTPKESCPTAGELVEYLKDWTKKNLGLSLPGINFLPMPVLGKIGMYYNRKTEAKKHQLGSNLLSLMPYFFDNHDFDRTNTEKCIGPYTIRWQDYADKILDFACSKNFMKQTERTVFEQAMVRRESSSYPITYYDITQDGITAISGKDMNKKIYRIAAALQSKGVVPGMKVALTGINCTDYIALDMAIGLCGAVSVPIYYTTPVAEINILLEKSGSEWFFIGDNRIMKQLAGLHTNAQTVSFGIADSCTEAKANYSWDKFLENINQDFSPVHVDPSSLATIRYTSGTTGDPKGVMFSFSQLQWMGEVLTNLLDWTERNRLMSYLSFLPQSHVVEGILAAYAPYYMLCKVELFYLNDFGALTSALPSVRPTVFFSVPRFYEKVWQQLTENSYGQNWLAMGDGLPRKILGKLVKKVILKKAGLDQCEQLIVGSAPVSEELLNNYRSLGIEIHNAYGQTEAPLITINRKNDNIIPSVGTPLPQTQVDFSSDGELIVTGPHVALGYYGLDTDTIQNGVLKTGDLGKLVDNDHIVLIGRKKEMIVTSYGKNINCSKIEERLKDIPEVSEAVLIGENRPYCTALIWLEGSDSLLGEKITAMNANLSHPEQIRRWTIIEPPLSIAAGELTPNLKVRRNIVTEHFHTEIEKMYEN